MFLKNIFFTKELFIDREVIKPYGIITVVKLKKKTNIIKADLKLNFQAIRIRYWSSFRPGDFLEKTYFSKNCSFDIKEIFENKISFIVIYNVSGCTLLKTQIKLKFNSNSARIPLIFLIKYFYDRINEIRYRKRIDKCVFIISRPKTGTTSLHLSLSRNGIPVCRTHQREKGELKDEFSIINPEVGNLYRKNLNENYEEYERKISNYNKLLSVINCKFLESQEKKFTNKIYITVFREIISEILARIFQGMGCYFVDKKLKKNEILNIFENKINSMLSGANNEQSKMCNYFPNDKININHFQEFENYMKYVDGNSEYYICTQKNLYKFYQNFMREKFGILTKLKRANMSKDKIYNKIYKEIKEIVNNNPKYISIKNKYKNIKDFENKLKIH